MKNNHMPHLDSLWHLTVATVRRAAVPSVLLSSCILSYAPPEEGADCRSCHATVQNGMYLSGNQSTTNLGAGLLKVYRVVQGNVASIEIQVTNRYNSTYGLSLLDLTAPGHSNPANRLAYTGDATWANRTVDTVNYFTVGPVNGTLPALRTHNLLIRTNTPPDIYKVQMQMAGPANGEWSQVEDFYIEVLSAVLPPAPAPTLTAPSLVAGQFTVHVVTVAGHTYHLEYKQSPGDPSWNPASQLPGNGTEITLTDLTATGATRFYRVRVQ